jgi:hypothetical protein
MAILVTKIRKKFEVPFSRILWTSTIEEVLGTSNFTSIHLNEKLVLPLFHNDYPLYTNSRGLSSFSGVTGLG